MTRDENIYRAYTFGRPESIPMRVAISNASWARHGKALEELVLAHKYLFPTFKKGDVDWNAIAYAPMETAGVPFTDAWGCVWETPLSGIIGVVNKHPLENWADLDSFAPPDPAKTEGINPLDWKEMERSAKEQIEQNVFTAASLEHGFLLLRLTYLRGFENLMCDMMDEHPRLPGLIAMVEKFQGALVERFLKTGVKLMAFPEDLGTQTNSILSPRLFEKYIKPSYMRLMGQARENGAVVHMHSDGYIMDLADDLLECGVGVLNPQDLVNGIDEIAKHLKGRVAIDLDVDRQSITRFGTPKDIDDLIREEVVKLGSPEGGLSLVWGLYQDAPLENIKAVMDAMEKYAFYYS